MARYGVANAGATLCSRFLGTPIVAYLTNDLDDQRRPRVWEVPADVLVQPMTTYFVETPGGPRFPYGWTVEPDVPV